jgi:hypothetical protein
MKVFLSHTASDKPVVEKFAVALRKILGQDNVFYDSWSISPGDGIIDKMNSGLSACDYFIFFISKKSLESKMVELEWQNALMTRAGRKLKFIPIKLDDCAVPAILSQTFYIDVAKNGLDAGLRQLLDVISGGGTYRPDDRPFENLRAFVSQAGGEYRVDAEIRATTYMEPHSRYCVLLENGNARLSCASDGFVMQGGGDPLTDAEGKRVLPYMISTLRATTPGFPFRFSINDDEAIHLHGILHAVSENKYRPIPITAVLLDSVFHFGGDVQVELDKVLGKDKLQQEQVAYLMGQIEKAKGHH